MKSTVIFLSFNSRFISRTLAWSFVFVAGSWLSLSWCYSRCAGIRWISFGLDSAVQNQSLRESRSTALGRQSEELATWRFFELDWVEMMHVSFRVTNLETPKLKRKNILRSTSYKIKYHQISSNHGDSSKHIVTNSFGQRFFCEQTSTKKITSEAPYLSWIWKNIGSRVHRHCRWIASTWLAAIGSWSLAFQNEWPVG